MMRKDDKHAEVNERILRERTSEFDKIEGPRVGDFVQFQDGSFERIASVYGDGTYFQLGKGNYYLYGKDGCSFSGGLYRPHPLVALTQTQATKTGLIWFFSNQEARAGNGVDFEIEFRVFMIKDEFSDSIKPGLYH